MKFNNSPYRHSFFHQAFVCKASILIGTLIITLCMALPILAESKIELEETEITGARELPKVLYIVPWKKTRPGGDPLPMHSLIDEAMSPIDVDVFKRQVRYHEMTQSPSTGTEK